MLIFKIQRKQSEESKNKKCQIKDTEDTKNTLNVLCTNISSAAVYIRVRCINHNSFKLSSRRCFPESLTASVTSFISGIMSCPRDIGCVNTDVGQPINTRRSAQMSPRRPQPAGHSLHPDYTEHRDRKLLLLPETSP